MLFDIESFDYSYFNEGSEGLKLALVHHLDMPIMRQKGFHIAPGTENQIAVTPTLMSTSANAMARLVRGSAESLNYNEFLGSHQNKEIATARMKYPSSSCRRTTATGRKRVEREQQTEVLQCRYEMSNCLFEAAFENILERCRCAPGTNY